MLLYISRDWRTIRAPEKSEVRTKMLCYSIYQDTEARGEVLKKVKFTRSCCSGSPSNKKRSSHKDVVLLYIRILTHKERSWKKLTLHKDVVLLYIPGYWCTSREPVQKKWSSHKDVVLLYIPGYYRTSRESEQKKWSLHKDVVLLYIPAYWRASRDHEKRSEVHTRLFCYSI